MMWAQRDPAGARSTFAAAAQTRVSEHSDIASVVQSATGAVTLRASDTAGHGIAALAASVDVRIAAAFERHS